MQQLQVDSLLQPPTLFLLKIFILYVNYSATLGFERSLDLLELLTKVLEPLQMVTTVF